MGGFSDISHFSDGPVLCSTPVPPAEPVVAQAQLPDVVVEDDVLGGDGVCHELRSEVEHGDVVGDDRGLGQGDLNLMRGVDLRHPSNIEYVHGSNPVGNNYVVQGNVAVHVPSNTCSGGCGSAINAPTSGGSAVVYIVTQPLCAHHAALRPGVPPPPGTPPPSYTDSEHGQQCLARAVTDNVFVSNAVGLSFC